MKKKIFALLMVICLIFAMATGCSGASEETDSGGGKTETETEAPAADDQQADDSKESEDVTTKEEDAVEGTDDSEGTSYTDEQINKLYSLANVTKEEMDSLYKTISDSIYNYYLKPNNIDSESFVIPDDMEWVYFNFLAREYSIANNASLEDIIGVVQTQTQEDGYNMSPETFEIANAIFLGTVDWYNSDDTNLRADFYEKTHYFSSIYEFLLEQNLHFD